jgi:hypothetical protein
VSVYIGCALLTKKADLTACRSRIIDAAHDLPFFLKWETDEIDVSFFHDNLVHRAPVDVFRICDDENSADATGLIGDCNVRLKRCVQDDCIARLLRASLSGQLALIDLGNDYYAAASATPIGIFLERMFFDVDCFVGMYIADGGPVSCETHSSEKAQRCLLNMLAIPWHALPNLGIVID